jgi:hypothetical protein
MAQSVPQKAPPTQSSETSIATPTTADFRVRQALPQLIATPVTHVPAPAPVSSVPNPLAALSALLPQTNKSTLQHLPTHSSQPQLHQQPPAIDAQKLAIIQLLVQQGVPVEQITAILQAQPTSTPPVPTIQPPFLDPRPRQRRPLSRSRSPPPRRRSSFSRSPSPLSRRPPPRRRDDSPPQRVRRGSPVYGDYRSRSRSPPSAVRRRSPPPRERSPIRKSAPPPTEFKPRYLEWDDSLKPDLIRGTTCLTSV